MLVRLLLLALAVTTALATTNNLDHALRHHSSVADAVHRQDHARTNNWLVFGADCTDQFARDIQRQLSAGEVHARQHASGTCVLHVDDAVHPGQLTTVLLSEQRAGRLTAFHRERVSKYISH